MIFLDKESIFLGGGIFYILTKNPNLTKNLFFFGEEGGVLKGGEG